MRKILVVERLNIFNIFIVIIYKFLKFEVYVYKFSKNIAKLGLLNFLSLQMCNFEECNDIGFEYCVGKNGDAIDEITNEFIDIELLNIFNPFFTNIKDSREKNKSLFKQYVLDRCRNLNEIYIWIDGYFLKYKENNIKIYVLADICKIGAKFLEIRSDYIKVRPVFSSNFFIIISLALKVLNATYRKLFSKVSNIFARKTTQTSSFHSPFINNNIDTLSYKVIYFPHKSIFYGDLYIKDNFYSKDMNSVFYPPNILHIELEDISISKNQHKYYLDNNISTVILPKMKFKESYNFFIYILREIGLKNAFLFLRKDVIQFFVFLRNTVKFLSTKVLVKENYNPKLALVGYDILFPTILSLAFESLKIKTVATQERFLPTFFSHIFFSVDTYLCNSNLVCKTIKDANNKFVNNCIPCGQIRSDILVEYQKNITSKNDRFTIVAFDFHSDIDFNNNRLEAIINWKANASFYRDLCNLADDLPQIDIIIRGKNTNWTSIPFFDDILNKIRNMSNIWIDDDYFKPNKQYELASKSNLVIAKPTSIGDELIAVGKRVIYYDYFPNSSHHFASEYFNYNNHNIFAFSFIQLQKMVQKVVNGEDLLTDIDVLELQIITNNAAADGKVREKVMENLENIYTQACL